MKLAKDADQFDDIRETVKNDDDIIQDDNAGETEDDDIDIGLDGEVSSFTILSSTSIFKNWRIMLIFSLINREYINQVWIQKLLIETHKNPKNKFHLKNIMWYLKRKIL